MCPQVPQFQSSAAAVDEAFYYGWAMYWMYTLDAQVGRWERVRAILGVVVGGLASNLQGTLRLC